MAETLRCCTFPSELTIQHSLSAFQSSIWPVGDSARYYDPNLGRFISADSIVPGAGALTVAPNDPVAAGAWEQCLHCPMRPSLRADRDPPLPALPTGVMAQ
ncbi:MAG: hypothetical protein SH847_26065 [Roseiflexaceae bacterium]|nr:hypothetical protein [Roseiflexaceae bacterium]